MTEAVRDFVLQIEKTLITRRLYAPHMAPFQEAARKLLEKGRAAGGDAFTLRLGPTDLFLEKASLIHREKREESFFFPLYRDGLRELTFSPEVSAEDLDSLLRTFEAEEKRVLGPSEDTVNFLWRCDLQTITYNAVDGIGDEEGDDEADSKDDFRALIADLAGKIKNPAPAAAGQTYAFLLDADVRVGAGDFHYEATTTHRAFEENATVLALTAREAGALQAELGEEREGSLLERFIEILLAILADPGRAVAAASLAPVFQRLLEGYWTARDVPALSRLLGRLDDAAKAAPHAESRAAAQEILEKFLNPERVRATFDEVRRGALPLEAAARIWDHAGGWIWDPLLDFWASLPEGPVRAGLTNLLRSKVAFQPDLLQTTLASPEPPRVRAGLALLDERSERVHAREVLALTAHADEGIRLKALAAAGRIGGPAALEAAWKVLQSDPSQSVRLFAFRMMAGSRFPGLAQRLVNLVTQPGFAERPAWEKEKYVRLLGSVADESVRPLFDAWIPPKKWFYSPQDLERAELAFHGLAALSQADLERVKATAAAGGKLGQAARNVLDALSRREPGDTQPPGRRR